MSSDNEVLGPDRLGSAVEQLGNGPRWAAVADAHLRGVTRFANGIPIFVAVVAIAARLISRRRYGAHDRCMLMACALCSALMLTMLAAVYVMSPFEVATHTRWSFDRRLLQLWPMWLFVLVGVSTVDTRAVTSD